MMRALGELKHSLRLHGTEGMLIILSLVFLCCSVIMIFAIYVSRTVKSRRMSRNEILYKRFQKVLNTIIVNESYSVPDHSDPTFEFWLLKLNEILRTSKRKKQILIDQLMSLKKSLAGESSLALSAVYFGLGLQRISLRKLASFRWEVQASGIRELAEMEYKPSIPGILKFIKSKNQFLREESLAALVRLEKERPLFYLNHYTGYLSLWMQINILYHLQSLDHKNIPDFMEWFYHPSRSVRCFCIKMVSQFRQLNSIPALVKLLADKDSKIKAMAVKALSELQAYAYVEDIARLAATGWPDKRLARQIMKALGELGTNAHVPVVSVYVTHPSYLVRFEAVRTLKLLGKINSGQADFDPGVKNILNHLSDPLLQ